MVSTDGSDVAAGHGHQAALRAVAHKWLKIILAMKRTGTPYDETVFLNSRRRYLLKTPLLTNVTSYSLQGA